MKIWFLAALLAMTSVTMTSVTMADTMDLSGTGTVTAEPDEGYITVIVDAVAPTSVDALAKNTVTMQRLYTRLYTRLGTLGVDKKNIKTTDFSLAEHWVQVDTEKVDRNGNPIFKNVKDGFGVTNAIRITVCDLTKFGQVLDAVVQDGASTVRNISFGSSKAEASLDAARTLAVKDAIRKANILADGLGVKLLKVTSVSESADRPSRIMYAAASADAAPGGAPISGGTLNFSISVQVRWELEKVDFRVDRPTQTKDGNGNPIKN